MTDEPFLPLDGWGELAALATRRARALEEGRRRKAHGQSVTLEHVPENYRQLYDEQLELCAESHQPFTSETITDRIGLPAVSGPNRNNVIGALMHAAARRGRIRKTGRMVPALRKRSNARELREWIGA